VSTPAADHQDASTAAHHRRRDPDAMVKSRAPCPQPYTEGPRPSAPVPCFPPRRMTHPASDNRGFPKRGGHVAQDRPRRWPPHPLPSRLQHFERCLNHSPAASSLAM